MRHWDREAIAGQLLLNKQVRAKRGALRQDFDRQPGEVFFANMKQQEFAALPLHTKRKGGLARICRLVGEIKNGSYRVYVPTYAEAHGDKESFEVFVHTFELDTFGLEY